MHIKGLVFFTSIILGGTAFKVEISHFNDVSGQIESFVVGTANSSLAPTPCPRGDLEELKCIGGVINIVHHLNQKLDPNSTEDIQRITILSGNVIGGESGWITSVSKDGWTRYAQEIVAALYKPNITALGMKEFGAGVPRTIDFVKNVPNVVLSNSCLKTYPEGSSERDFCNETLALVPKIRKIDFLDDETHSTRTVGFVSFVTPTAERLSIPGKLEFEDIVKSIKTVVDNHPDITTFIAAGDANLDTAKNIIDQVPKVKLVVYGAGLSNTQNMSSNYPLKHGNGYIVTAGRYGSSIGKLVIDIDSSNGNIKSAKGKIIPTVREYPLNPEAQSTFNKWQAAVDITKKSHVAHTRVTLEGGEKCWRQECNLGNLVTDSMVHCALQRPKRPFDFRIHAIWHGGAFFEEKVNAGTSISAFDLHKWLPYHNRAHLVKITGSNLWEVFEESARGVNPQKAGVKDWRQFLQVSSGMEIYIDTKSTNSPKLQKVRMIHDNDGVPVLSDMDKSKEYYLVIPTYLYEGRGVYDFAAKFWEDVVFNGTSSNLGFDDECLQNYATALGQIQVGFEERIWIDADPHNPQPSDNCPGRKTALTVILTIVFYSLFLAIIYVGYYYVLPRLRRQPVEFYPRNQD